MNFKFKLRGLSNLGKLFYFYVTPTVTDICAKFHVNVIICYIVTLVFSKRLKVIFSIFTMSELITGDETWIYAYDPETTDQSSKYRAKVAQKSRSC